MNNHRYESYLLLVASYLSLLAGFLCYIATQEKWTLVVCVLCGLVLLLGSEQANKKALIIERGK